MVRRGVALVKKKDSKWRDAWIDSNGEETSPPPNEQLTKEKCPTRKQPQKLSSEPRPPVKRQASPNHEQSADRNEALTHLFSDPPDAPYAPTPLGGPLSLLSDAQDHQGTFSCHSTVPPEQTVRPQQKALPKNHPTFPPPAPPGPAPLSKSVFIEPLETLDNGVTIQMASANNFIPTGQFRNMRACMVCAIIKTQQQFLNHGCPNCGFLELRGNQEGVQDCTSQVFEGLITVSDTNKSWVARWQRLEGYVPGCYAVQVEGILPEDAITAAEENGVHYIPRDGSVNEALPTDA